MKKTIVSVLIVLFAAGAYLYAAESAAVKLSLVPGVSTPDRNIVKGLDFGLFATKTERVSGVQFAPFYADISSKSEGFQFALWSAAPDFDGAKIGYIYNKARDIKGYQGGMIYSTARAVYGGQAGGIYTTAADIYGYQAGLVAVNRKLNGLQYGFVTTNGAFKGMQMGFVNVSDDASGFQLGFVNVARTLKGLQVGFVNIISKGGMLPVMVLFNGSF